MLSRPESALGWLAKIRQSAGSGRERSKKREDKKGGISAGSGPSNSFIDDPSFMSWGEFSGRGGREGPKGGGSMSRQVK